MTNKKKTFWGIVSLVLPISLFVFVLVAYAISNFVISSMSAAGGASDLGSTIGSLISMVLGLLGILSMIGIPVGLIVGIILLTSKKSETQEDEVKNAEQVLQGEDQDEIVEIKDEE